MGFILLNKVLLSDMYSLAHGSAYQQSESNRMSVDLKAYKSSYMASYMDLFLLSERAFSLHYQRLVSLVNKIGLPNSSLHDGLLYDLGFCSRH